MKHKEHFHVEVKSGNATLSDKQKEFQSKNKNHYIIDRRNTFWWF